VSLSRSRVRVCIRLLTAPDFCKTGHLQIQKGPQGVKRGQHPPHERPSSSARSVWLMSNMNRRIRTRLPTCLSMGLGDFFAII
jgi:hypothetical protein